MNLISYPVLTQAIPVHLELIAASRYFHNIGSCACSNPHSFLLLSAFLSSSQFQCHGFFSFIYSFFSVTEIIKTFWDACCFCQTIDLLGKNKDNWPRFWSCHQQKCFVTLTSPDIAFSKTFLLCGDQFCVMKWNQTFDKAVHRSAIEDVLRIVTLLLWVLFSKVTLKQEWNWTLEE